MALSSAGTRKGSSDRKGRTVRKEEEEKGKKIVIFMEIYSTAPLL